MVGGRGETTRAKACVGDSEGSGFERVPVVGAPSRVSWNSESGH